jgi:hypothetical protein
MMAASLGLELRKRLRLTQSLPREIGRSFYVAASLGLEPRLPFRPWNRTNLPGKTDESEQLWTAPDVLT